MTAARSVVVLNQRSWHHPRAGGAERNLEATLTRLAERGHSVELLTGAEPGCPRTERDGVTIRRVGVADRVPAPFDVLVTYLSVTLYCYYVLLARSPDVVYAVDTPLPWPVLTRRPRVPVYHHLVVDEVFETHPFPLDYCIHAAQRLGVRLGRGAPAVSVSPTITDALVERGHDPAAVHEIRNGVDVDAYVPGEDAPEPRVCFLGVHHRYKGADRLPAIHEALADRVDRPVRLDVAGLEGPLSDRLERYCRDAEHAQFHGYVDSERKLELLQSAWVLVVPSRVESWGIVVLEANACGTPAVGADAPGLRDSIRDGETGLRCPGEPRVVAEHVASLLDDPERRAALGERARTWAEEHSWDAAADDLEALFDAVAAR